MVWGETGVLRISKQRKGADRYGSYQYESGAVLASVNGEKGNLVCACSAAARDKGAHAGKIVQRVAAVTGGKGGGKPDSAMAGIGKTYMVDEALLALDGIAAEFLKED